MSIKSIGGIFGRNPTFRNVVVEGDLDVAGSLLVNGQTISGLDFQGSWDATSGSPAATPLIGQFWIVSVAGTTSLDGITNWGIGDWALYDGSSWQRIEGGADGNFKELTSTSTTVLNGTTIPASKTLVVTTDIGSTVQAYDATILNAADIGVTVQSYDADTAKYDDTTANFTGTLQNGGSNVVVDTDIGSTVQGYDADTAKYDDATANFTGTLQNGGSDVVVDTDIGSTVQGYDADTAKYDDTTANFTGTLQNNGSQVYSRSNIVGTVSESSGTPTGEIIERGSNANGIYTKYADGTLIMNHTYAATYDSAATFRDDLTFPATHASGTATSSTLSIVGGNVIGMSGGNVPKMLSPRFYSITATTCRADVPTVAGETILSGDSYTATYIAIGKWY